MTARVYLGRPARFRGGVHPPGRKDLAGEQPIAVLPAPAEVTVPLLQHAGAPAEAIVERRQEVAWGEVIAKPAAFVSAFIHAPVAGTMQRATAVTLPNGRHVQALVLKAAAEQPAPEAIYDTLLGGEWDLEADRDPEEVVAVVRDAGIVGFGGAAFPTHVKLARNPQRPVDTLLVNGCECEPYLTADQRLMIEAPRAILAGVLLAARAVGATRVLVAVEDNKPAAIAALRAAARDTAVTIQVLGTRYPLGGERQLLPAALGRTVPFGGLPLDVGVVVLNVATAAAVAAAVERGRPVTHRVVTVTGDGVASPRNVLAPIGTAYRALLEFCGGLTAEADRVIAGGPMMGFTVANLDTPLTKGTSGITVLTAAQAAWEAETACLRCGRCYDVCPLRLVPTKLAEAARWRDWELARRYHLPHCQECGCCAYVCPARVPLVQLIRMGKAMMPRD